MTQYPPPPYPAPYSPEQPRAADPLAAARRASVLLWIIGAFLVLGGACSAATSRAMTRENLVSTEQGRRMLQQFDQLEAQLGFPFQSLVFGVGVTSLAFGAVFGLLAFWVRRGGTAAAITSILVAGPPLFVVGFGTAVGLQQLLKVGPQALPLILVYGVPFAILILLVAWLVRAARNGAGVMAGAAQANAQYWQSQQQRQQYQQPGPGAPAGELPPQYAPPPQQGFYPPPPPQGSSNAGYGYAQRPPPPPGAGNDEQSGGNLPRV